MKIKGLLFGSAAAILTFNGAYAANEVVAEPEPAQFVRVCDAYGAGYFYIPGTETCMRISGYVRSELKGGDNIGARLHGGINRDTYAWRSRMALNLHTATETELGTLRSFMQIRSNWQRGAELDNGSADLTQLRFAYIELAGLRVGLDESIFNHWTGYNGAVLNDDVVNPMLYTRTNVISYTYNSGSGFSAILGLEQGNDEMSDPYNQNFGYSFHRDAAGNLDYKTQSLSGKTTDYTPNVLGGLKLVQGWGGVSAVAAYDAYYQKWATKARLDLNVTDQWSVWIMGGYKSADDYYNFDKSFNQTTSQNAAGSTLKRLGIYRMVNSIYGDWGGDWSAWGGTTYKFNRQTSFNAQASYDDDRTFAASLNIRYDLVPGFTITPEISYISWDSNKKFTDAADTVEYVNSLKGNHAVQGMVRIQRSF